MKVYVVVVDYIWLDGSNETGTYNDRVFSTLESAVDYIESLGFVKNECIGGHEDEPVGYWVSQPKIEDDKRTYMQIDRFDLLY